MEIKNKNVKARSSCAYLNRSHEDVQKSEGAGPGIRNSGTKWRLVDNVTPHDSLPTNGTRYVQ